MKSFMSEFDQVPKITKPIAVIEKISEKVNPPAINVTTL